MMGVLPTNPPLAAYLGVGNGSTLHLNDSSAKSIISVFLSVLLLQQPVVIKTFVPSESLFYEYPINTKEPVQDHLPTPLLSMLCSTSLLQL